MRNVEAESTAQRAERISSRQRSSMLKGSKIEVEKVGLRLLEVRGREAQG
jgi:hypothetical protein